jgi:peptide/nickel transport system substrate-binding protein
MLRSWAIRSWPLLVWITAFSVVLGACDLPTQVELPTTPGTAAPLLPPATDLPPEPKTAVVCLAHEPESLYLYSPLRLYGAANREADAVLSAIYDGPFDIRGYGVEAVILEKAPSLADGDARLEAVSVGDGDIYLNPETLQPDQLRTGRPFLPSGCRDRTCEQIFRGGQVTMDRMVVEFHLLPDVRWSDGQPVTAEDSAFSFQVEVAGDTPTPKYLVNRTQSYQAVDDRTTRWTGIAGFLDPDYASNFWTPLPRHLLGEIPPADLLEDDGANRSPIGWGPFVLESWSAGREIILRRNPVYFRASEGLPRLEFLVFRFVGSDPQAALQQVLTGECDILDESTLGESSLEDIAGMAASGQLGVSWVAGPLVERLDFNLAPVGGVTTPFGEVSTRRALAGCIDRSAMVAEILFGMGAVTDSYMPPDHPLYAAGMASIAHDVEGSTARLQELGWVDHDGNAVTPRVAQGVPGVAAGTPLTFTYSAPADALHRALADHLSGDLMACGVEVVVDLIEPPELMALWPEGLVFGRAYQVVGWSWLTGSTPPCEMFSRREFASDDNPYGGNATGMRDADYDRACDAMLLGIPGSSEVQQAARRTQEILLEMLPTLPLFARPRLIVHSPQVCGLAADPSVYSLLWDVEVVDVGQACQGGEDGP